MIFNNSHCTTAGMVSVRPGVGGTYQGVLDGRLNIIRRDMLKEMECVKLADLYRNMKERLAAEPDQEW